MRFKWISLLATAGMSAALAVPALASAAPKTATPQLIEQAADGGRIQRDTATLYLAYALGRPAKLPAAYRSDTPWDGTLPLRLLRAAVPRMKPGPKREEAQKIVDPAAQPGSGVSCSSSSTNLANSTSTTHFYVEYGTVGGGLSISSYTTSLEQGWNTEVNTFGWAAPPVAPTPAPGSKYHVRVDSLSSGLYGFVSSSGTYAGPVGDNPNTAWNDVDAQASCMVLNRDYSGFPSTPQASLDSTTAHEFNHSLQYGYGALNGANTPDSDFVEGGATWMEDEVQDAANDNYNYLWPPFSDSMGAYGGNVYAYWITFRGLTERYGPGVAGGAEQVMQDFWEETSKNTGNNLTAMQTALANRGTNLADAFHAYAIAVKFNKACGGGYSYPYCFEEGPGYVTKKGATPVARTLSSVGTTTPNTGVEDNYALSWVQLPASGGPYDVTLSNTSAGGQLRGTVACDTGSSLSLSPFASVVGAGATTILSGYNPAGCSGPPVAVITNQSQTAPNPSSSTSRNYTVGTSAVATPQHQLTVSTTGSGSVASSPAGINCGADCSQSYNQGTVVTLTPTPTAGWAFTGWGGACSGTGTCQVTMDAAKNVTATFTQQSFALNVTKVGNGTVTSTDGLIACGSDCSETYPGGTSVTLSAVADAGWRFAGWSGGGCSGTGNCQVSMTAIRNVTATFVQQFQLSVSKGGSGSGSVSSSPSGISCGATCSAGYDAGTSVTLTASPSAGSSFTAWSGGGCSGTGTCVVPMDAAKSVTATFTQNPPNQFSLTVQDSGSGTGTVTSGDGFISCGSSCTHTYTSGTGVALNAAANGGSRFGGWSGGGCSGSGSCNLTMNQDTIVTATFIAQRQLSVIANGSGTVTSSPPGAACSSTCSTVYDQGTSVTLTAAPTAGWSFAGWSGGGCSGTGNCIVTMDGTKSVTATFTENPPPGGDGGGTPPPDSGSTVITSPPLVPPTLTQPVAPLFSLSLARLRPADAARRGVPLSVRCGAACRLLARLYLDGATARRLGLARRSRVLMVGSASAVRTAAGTVRLVVRLNARTKRAVARATTVAFALRVRGLDSTGQVSRTRYYRVTVRRRGRSPIVIPLAAAPSGVP